MHIRNTKMQRKIQQENEEKINNLIAVVAFANAGSTGVFATSSTSGTLPGMCKVRSCPPLFYGCVNCFRSGYRA